MVAAVERDYRNQSWGRTGWPFTRWVRALRPDPMKRLRLNTRDAVEEKLAVTARRRAHGPGAFLAPTAHAGGPVRGRAGHPRVGTRPHRACRNRWAEAVADAATPPGPELADALDQAVVGTSLKMRPPVWWQAFGLAQLVLAFIAALGFVWLAVLVVMRSLALTDAHHATLRPVALPVADVRRWSPARPGAGSSGPVDRRSALAAEGTSFVVA